MAAPRLKVAFRVRHRCRYGESLYVVGESPQLGNWEPSRTMARLAWSQDDVWEGEACLSPPSKDALEYKYVVVCGDSNQWQQGGNHKLDGWMDSAWQQQAVAVGAAVRLVVNHESWEDVGGQVLVKGLEVEEGRAAALGMDTVLGDQSIRGGLDLQQPGLSGPTTSQALPPAFAFDMTTIEELRKTISRHEEISQQTQDKTSREMLKADRVAAKACLTAISQNDLLLRAQGIRRMNSVRC